MTEYGELAKERIIQAQADIDGLKQLREDFRRKAGIDSLSPEMVGGVLAEMEAAQSRA